MKKSLHILFAAALSLTTSSALAYDFTTNGWYFNKVDGGVELTYEKSKACAYSGDVNVPSTVEYEGQTYTVVGLGQSAIRYGYQAVTSITIPETITSLGYASIGSCYLITEFTMPNSVTTMDKYVFNSCPLLAKVNFSSSLTTIGAGAFMYCWSLTDVVLPESLTELGQNAFQNCFNLKTVKIPASTTTIGQSAFKDCSHIESIEVDPANPNYSSADGILYNKDKTELIQYNGGRNVEKFTIPEGVKKLAYYSFGADSALVEVTLPSTLETVYNTAFYKAVKLAKVNFNEKLTTIGTQGFYGCAQLTDIVLPNSVTEVQQQSFYNCTGLKAVTFGTGTTTIGAKVFVGCSALANVTVNATTPPTLTASAFDDATYSSATLYVPAESVEAYKADDTWSKFTTIKASTSGIESISGDNATPLYYVDLSGRVVSQPASGLNLVKMSDGSVKKVVVK